MRRALACVCVLLLLLPALISCEKEKSFWAGEPMTAEELERMKDELKSESEKDEKEKETPVFDGTVYWLKNGTVYHMDSTCYHIKGKENVQSGSEEDATAAGKTKACSHCKID